MPESPHRATPSDPAGCRTRTAAPPAGLQSQGSPGVRTRCQIEIGRYWAFGRQQTHDALLMIVLLTEL